MAHEYLNAFINNSSTIRENAGADLLNPRSLAVQYDGNGNVIIATSGDKAIGVVLSDTRQTDGATANIKEGEPLDIQIKYIGLIQAGAAVAKGDLVTINATGQAITATAGTFVFGRAFTAATATGQLVQVLINPQGYIPAA